MKVDTLVTCNLLAEEDYNCEAVHVQYKFMNGEISDLLQGLGFGSVRGNARKELYGYMVE